MAGFVKSNDGFHVILNGRNILSNVCPVLTISGKKADVACEISDTEIILKDEEVLENGRIRIEEEDGTAFLYVSVKLRENTVGGLQELDAAGGFSLTFDSFGETEKMLAIVSKNAWWMGPEFPAQASELPEETFTVMVKDKETHKYYLPMPISNALCELKGADGKGMVCINSGNGQNEISGCFLAVSLDKNPYRAADKVFSTARKHGVIDVPLKSERHCSDMFNYFGWCSWDAFYHDVTEEGLLAKLSELKEKNIPVKWILIDDGWSQYADSRLISFKEDTEKFPNGLKSVVKTAKEQYGIEYVGVWHAFLGYWQGIQKNSEVYAEQKENLIETRKGIILPDCRDKEKAFSFWSAWHRYLKEQGIDFVKIDAQGSLLQHIKGEADIIKSMKNMHEAVDTSVELYFDGRLINCMGVTQQNIFSRPKSALTRNSDDFFPNKDDSFANHLKQNAYNSMMHDQIYCCDWDMWWSTHPTAIASGVLRAVSGGPVYVSDRVYETCSEMVLPLVEENGRILKCDRSARPTADMLYNDPEADGFVAKLFNTVGECGVLALFNISSGNVDAEATVRIQDIDGIDHEKEYVAYSFFGRKFYHLTPNDVLTIEVKAGETEVINFYPVENGSVLLGDVTKYISCASEQKTKTSINEIDFANF